MANRTFEQFSLTLERKTVKLYAKILYASGAPTLVSSQIINAGTSPVTINPSQGFQSLTDLGSGQFTLTLGANNGGVPTYDPYVRLLNVSASAVSSAGWTAGALVTTLVITDNVNGSSGNPSLTLETVAGSGGGPAAGVLSDGTVLLVEVTLSNTTAY
jgi:hypothetical protein